MREANAVGSRGKAAERDTLECWGGVDLGGTKIEAVVVDRAGTVLGKMRQPTPADGEPGDVVRAIHDTLEGAAHAAGLTSRQLLGVGVGAPGAVNANEGTLGHVSNVGRGWSTPYPVAGDLGARVGRPVVLGNDVQVAVAAEYRLGAGRAYRSLLGVWWGTGVGGGLVLDGVPWRGRGSAGEVGHMVVKPGGARCGCGRRGCLEAYAGRASMERRAHKAVRQGETTILFDLMRKKGRPRLTSSIWARALAQEDALATWLIGRAVRMLGAGLASAINLLDVEAVVLGGGLGTRLGPEFAGRIHEAMRPHIFVPERQPPVRVAELGELSGAIGAALLAQPPMK
ncbi:ROK family protein [Myxococcus xanthus]|uniref:Glucokinase n=1 Tax=Myxococcus xanthus TaxID=34 RepID=A0AAE6FW69_MYXXA|nr:ROK family protein [Myxococcus xanthus]QDE66478.1 glucokinase [Myxococcus xanthus]QDE73751.1 glucokinase [Myxococcus xanthus]QDE81011.1 glucokinase [Myxococcus xanthus]QDE95343.1 glucokinase [Myxococcus xanthus]QDF02622.1 glucokinase [Myxococcus xanthus]